jgi:5'-nucleotidase
MPRPRALITNDDGIDSRGIAVLTAAATEAGFEVTVAAPGWDSSGASASLTAVEERGKVVMHEFEIDALGIPAVIVEAPPAFIVRAAVSGAFGEPPDVVLAGVNQGANTGHVVVHSGTVGAAFTASTYGLPALAASLVRDGTWRWETARRVLKEVVPWLTQAEGPMVLNLNVPAVAPAELRGIARARLARFGAVQANVTEEGAGWVRLAYEPGDDDREPGTDAALLDDGYATLTALVAVCEDHPADLSGLRLVDPDDGVTAGGAAGGERSW